MKALFKPFLVNEPHKDPALYIDLFGRKEAFLVDLGDISRLTIRRMLKLSRIFVSHTHIDHFFGFDSVLRTSLSKRDPLHIYGPKNIIKNVAGKIAGYTWNLIKEYPLNIYVHEFHGSTLRTVLFAAQNELKPVNVEKRTVKNGLLFEDHQLLIKAVIVDHKIPTLAFLFEEKKRLNVRKEMLTKLDLTPGPWLTELKNRVMERKTDGSIEIPVCGKKKRFSVAKLAEQLLLLKDGEKVLYVTDIQFSNKNVAKLKKSVLAPDILFCEAFFIDDDKERAHDRYHLTAKQTNKLAQMLKAKKLVIFHFSPRYKGNFKKIYEEAFASRK